jgi:hypothetical protein
MLNRFEGWGILGTEILIGVIYFCLLYFFTNKNYSQQRA